MRWLVAFTFLLIGMSAAESGSYVAPDHHRFHAWYQAVQAELGISGCCDKNNQDCGPVADYHDLGEGGVNVFLPDDGRWHFTEEARKYYVDTPDGRAHVCRQPMGNSLVGGPEEFLFYCVFLPNPLSRSDFKEGILDASLYPRPAPLGAGLS